MPNKNRTKRKVAVKQPKPKPATPFSDAGAIVGTKLGSMFNAPYLKGVGKWLGSGIGQIFGSGDYQVVGALPNYNVLMNSQIPKFSSSKQTNIVCHREYLGDILGTAGFSNTAYPLNPGVSATFPWLSTIAQNYQEYKFHGLIFEFRPLITDFVTNGAPGVVVMATNYNADAPVYLSKQEMENSEYAVSVKPTRELMHGIECDTNQTVLPQLYIRSGSVPSGQDLRLYDLGNFQFATQTNPVQNLGELWVSYCVEFFKPVLPSDVGGNVLGALINRNTTAAATPMGSVGLPTTGDLPTVVTPTSIAWFANPGNLYLVTLSWIGSVATVSSLFPNVGPNGCAFLTLYNNRTAQSILLPADGAVTKGMSWYFVVQCTNPNPGFISLTFTTGGQFPSGVTTFTAQISAYSSEAV
jgi:hypothetical protein